MSQELTAQEALCRVVLERTAQYRRVLDIGLEDIFRLGKDLIEGPAPSFSPIPDAQRETYVVLYHACITDPNPTFLYRPDTAQFAIAPQGLQRFWPKVSAVESSQKLAHYVGRHVAINGYVAGECIFYPEVDLEQRATLPEIPFEHALGSSLIPAGATYKGRYGTNRLEINVAVNTEQEACELVDKPLFVIGKLHRSNKSLYLNPTFMRDALVQTR
ncbi:hypothetical protein HYV86_00820 [Candidatus Woesearchaeota archaeon]|nr:hypothetical protein [Candidatus Woesearchaeota archaeon]